MNRRALYDDELERKIRELTDTLTRILRHQLNRERGGFSVDEARRIAKMQLYRQGRPASNLGADARIAFNADLNAFASELKDPTRPAELVRFAKSCVKAAYARQPRRQALNVRVAQGERIETLTKAAIQAEYLSATTDDNVVQRAVTRLIHERRRGQRGFASLRLDDKDVIRELFDLPKFGRLALPSSDIRVHMARAINGTSPRRVGRGKKKTPATTTDAHPFGETLRHAALFSEVHLQDALGGELLLLGQPVGFTDARRRAVLFEVRSAAAAHQLNMRRQEVIYRLQQVSGFENVRDVRTEVRGYSQAHRTPPKKPNHPNMPPLLQKKSSPKKPVDKNEKMEKVEEKPGVESEDLPSTPTSDIRLKDVIARLQARARGEIE
ncbi:MAG: DUF721 domain-containing protein [Deltaproteobacteria bacterium]|nr:DUF721 domain-containing protein [Deltaproteobacteria bacterium]